ncbi:hypothetical protein [Streptomyces malaysiensis]|uniref:hypothetical protein n=1 Tax=Streptomyces malaysiensis TaxID=92644 RepID=UPI00369A8F12
MTVPVLTTPAELYSWLSTAVRHPSSRTYGGGSGSSTRSRRRRAARIPPHRSAAA